MSRFCEPASRDPMSPHSSDKVEDAVSSAMRSFCLAQGLIYQLPLLFSSTVIYYKYHIDNNSATQRTNSPLL
ncbi:MAG: hypothetical protein K6D59_11200 [Bacteroidales bacterium]|nr:hypothetical protein [Bacteroidales bacterium]